MRDDLSSTTRIRIGTMLMSVALAVVVSSCGTTGVPEATAWERTTIDGTAAYYTEAEGVMQGSMVEVRPDALASAGQYVGIVGGGMASPFGLAEAEFLVDVSDHREYSLWVLAKAHEDATVEVVGAGGVWTARLEAADRYTWTRVSRTALVPGANRIALRQLAEGIRIDMLALVVSDDVAVYELERLERRPGGDVDDDAGAPLGLSLRGDCQWP